MASNTTHTLQTAPGQWKFVKYPWYAKRECTPGIRVHRFYRDAGEQWLKKFPRGHPLNELFQLLHNDGVYTIVEILEAQTSVLGPPKGTGIFNPVADTSRYPKNSLVVNFSFYVHCKNYFRRSENDEPLRAEGLYYPVGECSYTDDFIPVSKSYRDLFVRRVMTNGSYATAGPTLNEPLDMTPPSHAKINTPKGRFHYFWLSPEGDVIDNPVSRDEIEATPLVPGSTVSIKAEIEGFMSHGKNVEQYPDGTWTFATNMTPQINAIIKNKWSSVPGNLAHASQPKERAGITEHPNGTVVSHTYTCDRGNGITINAQREIMQAGCKFLGLEFSDIKPGKAYGLDGGPSILQAMVLSPENKTFRVLSMGNMRRNLLEDLPYIAPNQPHLLPPFRRVANVMVIHSTYQPPAPVPSKADKLVSRIKSFGVGK